MRRLTLILATLLTSAAAFAASPFYLDRSGVLWKAEASEDGLVLTAERNGEEVLQSAVPFGVGLAGVTDDQIRVVADDLTGIVAVVWQRTWSEGVTEILLALWRDDAWLAIERLSGDVFANPRFPRIDLSQVATRPEEGAEPIRESFLQVVWWQGGEGSQHGTLSVIRLSDPHDVLASRLTYNLDDFIPIGIACRTPAPSEVLEHPLFPGARLRDRSLVFYGAEGDCFFYLLEVRFELEETNAPDGGDETGATTNTIAQRRRHWPIFGVKKVFLLPEDFSLEDSRVVIGADLVPVAYRVTDGQLEYVVNEGLEWSEPRTLRLKTDLTLDQAIPLVENLAH